MDQESVVVNMWKSFRDDGIRQWAHGWGHPIRCIDVTHLPLGEPLVVDRAAILELNTLILGGNEELGHYLMTRPLVLVAQPGEPLYPSSLTSFTLSGAAVVQDGDYDSLREALCPLQFEKAWSQFVEAFGPPQGIETKMKFRLSDFMVPAQLRQHLDGCSACRARVTAQISSLELKLALIRNIQKVAEERSHARSRGLDGVPSGLREHLEHIFGADGIEVVEVDMPMPGMRFGPIDGDEIPDDIRAALNRLFGELTDDAQRRRPGPFGSGLGDGPFGREDSFPG